MNNVTDSLDYLDDDLDLVMDLDCWDEGPEEDAFDAAGWAKSNYSL